MAELTYREAVAEAIAQAMRRDEDVVFLGEAIGAAGGVLKATGGPVLYTHLKRPTNHPGQLRGVGST